MPGMAKYRDFGEHDQARAAVELEKIWQWLQRHAAGLEHPDFTEAMLALEIDGLLCVCRRKVIEGRRAEVDRLRERLDDCCMEFVRWRVKKGRR